MKGKYYSTKRFGPTSTGHRQYLASKIENSKSCSMIHGYGRVVEITFGGSELDERGWLVNYGGLKEVKQWLETEWDHRTLISSNDPLIPELLKLEEIGGININIMDAEKGYGPGIEQSCKYVFDWVDNWIQKEYEGRCWVQSVRIWEHENNSSIYTRD